MNPAKLLTTATVALAAVFLASCGTRADKDPSGKPVPGSAAKFVNPHKPGTYEHFKAEPKYPKTHDVWKNDELLPKTDASNSRVVISLSKQRGFLMNGDQVVIDYPICSGIKSRPTPTGDFKVLEKVVDKQSNRYGKIYDATGNLVNGDADAQLDPIPEGGKFEGANMHYWMRLTWDGVGHHIGPVKRYPASHACIRGPRAVMPIVYSKMAVGSRISVAN
jgi:hypothetical protein